MEIVGEFIWPGWCETCLNSNILYDPTDPSGKCWCSICKDYKTPVNQRSKVRSLKIDKITNVNG